MAGERERAMPHTGRAPGHPRQGLLPSPVEISQHKHTVPDAEYQQVRKTRGCPGQVCTCSPPPGGPRRAPGLRGGR